MTATSRNMSISSDLYLFRVPLLPKGKLTGWRKSSHNFSVEFVALHTYSLGIQDSTSLHTEFSLVMGQRI